MKLGPVNVRLRNPLEVLLRPFAYKPKSPGTYPNPAVLNQESNLKSSLPYPEFARPVTAQEPSGYIPKGQSLTPRFKPLLPPNFAQRLRVVSGSQQMQPFGSSYEDALTALRAIQPTGYSNQTSLHEKRTQGPMASFYKLRGF